MTPMRLVLALLAALVLPTGAYATCCNGGPQAATGSGNANAGSVQGAGPGATSMPVNDAGMLTAYYAGLLTPPFAVTQSGPWIVSATDTPLDGLTYTGTISAAGVVPFTAPGQTSGVVDMTGYGSISVQITGNAGANTFNFQCSNDNTNWVACFASFPSGNTGVNAYVYSGTATGLYVIQKQSRYFRISIVTYVSGAFNVSVVQNFLPGYTPIVGQGPSASVANPWYVIQAPTGTTSSLSVVNVYSAATTNNTQIKTASGNIYGLALGNTSTVASPVDACLHFYNVAAAPTVGTTAAVFTVFLPAHSVTNVHPAVAIPFSTGIFYAITPTCSPTDTASITAGLISGEISAR